eukprot:CAMPEP_0183475996 /NCGR_PEP_ID=MMETSP0370-20130417/165724_1 /TAXON_ID=268820 /ORGANISM="Peridinium aciculiferum, Strain PAER-2" /LENGTH=121 /DNA_ID=CAMNT_0025668813 /DNA_START=95 /DNA_END=460 /DNA_ORIENTATION=-
MANVFCQVSFGAVSPTDEATRGLIIETLNASEAMKEAGIVVEDASFVYHPEKNVEEHLVNGLGGALFTVPEDKLADITRIERMTFQGQETSFLVMFDLTKQDRAYFYNVFGKVFEAGEMGE